MIPNVEFMITLWKIFHVSRLFAHVLNEIFCSSVDAPPDFRKKIESSINGLGKVPDLQTLIAFLRDTDWARGKPSLTDGEMESFGEI